MSETKPTGLVLSGIWTLLSLRAEKENVTNISQNFDDFLHTLPYDSVSSLLDVYQKKKKCKYTSTKQSVCKCSRQFYSEYINIKDESYNHNWWMGKWIVINP